jgi:hypothetical protein
MNGSVDVSENPFKDDKPLEVTSISMPQKRLRLDTKSIFSLLPLLFCSLGYIYCILLSTTPITNVDWKSPGNIGKHLLRLSPHLPADLHFSSDFGISHQLTGFVEFMLLMMLAFLFYAAAAVLVRRQEPGGNKKATIALIWSVVLVSGSLYIVTTGELAHDIDAYVTYGRLLGIYHANPYFVPPSAFPHDPAYPFTYWKDTVTIYGPLWTVISTFLALIAGSAHTHILYTFRIFSFAMHLVNMWLIGAILRDYKCSSRTIALGILLYALNPLALLESSLGGHNDILMITFILLGIWLVVRVDQYVSVRFRDYAPPIIAFTCAFLIKFSAAPVIFLYIFALVCKTLQQLSQQDMSHSFFASFASHWFPALIVLLKGALVSLGLVIFFYVPFYVEHSIHEIVLSYTSLPFNTQIWNSILFAINSYNGKNPLPFELLWLNQRNSWSILNYGGIILVGVYGAIRIWRKPTLNTMIVALFAVFSVFLLTTTWFFSWYVTWLVALAAICLPVSPSRFDRGLLAFGLTFSYTTLATYYSTIAGWMQNSHNAVVPNWPLQEVLIAFGVPMLVGLISVLYWPFKHAKQDKVV